jgi:hypothetical protein
MKSPDDRSDPRPGDTLGAVPAAEGPEESTEERTLEWDVGQMDAGLLESEAPATPPPDSGQAIVGRPIEDESAGARSERDLAARRQRRDTVPSPVPSMLAKSMRPAPAGRPRDPAAPPAPQAEVSRRVASGSNGVPVERDSSAYSVEVGDRAGDVHAAPTAESPLPALGPVALLVDQARRCLLAGDVMQAVVAASGAIAASETQVEPGVGDLGDTARGPLAPIFAAGPADKVLAINRSQAELDRLVLDEISWALLRRVDGRSTLGQLFSATRIPPTQALRHAASLLRDGVLRVEDRART